MRRWNENKKRRIQGIWIIIHNFDIFSPNSLYLERQQQQQQQQQKEIQ